MSVVNPEVEKRRFKRARLDTALRYRFKQSNEFGSTLTYDISEGGAKFIFDKFVPLNTDFVLEFALGNFSGMVNAVGKVVWAKRVPYSERYQLGVEFREIQQQHKKDISDYVKSRRF